jgi:O-antigen biosynthesis protein
MSHLPSPVVSTQTFHAPSNAARSLELTQPIQSLCNLEDYAKVRIFPTWQGAPVGYFELVSNHQAEINADILTEEIAKLKWEKLPELPPLDTSVKVSIVIATCDRPAVLKQCLQAIEAQVTQRQVEVIVVDNRPQSGLTAPIATEFPHVKVVVEDRVGVSYARNTGILASSGEIILVTDDDVVVTEDWLENLVAPFTRPEVMAVTGNVLPLEIDTPAQQAFEYFDAGLTDQHRGLSRGFKRVDFDRHWFNFSWPIAKTWLVGVTANAAFRASIFRDAKVGLMNEALGPGTPSGAGEDNYIFYRILKTRGVIVYEPRAYVWHQHRRHMPDLKRQIYAYGKSFTAYQIVTLLVDFDLRVMILPFVLPLHYILFSFLWLMQGRRYPLSLIGWNILGNFMGIWGIWKSWQNVRRWGRSENGAVF